MSEFKFESSAHFANSVIKIASNNGYNAYPHKFKLVLVYNKYSHSIEKLNNFTAEVKFATNKPKQLIELIELHLQGEHIPKFTRSKPGNGSKDYLKSSYTDEQKQHFEKLWNKSGIYKLYDCNGELKYIGKSVNLGGRIVGSMHERKLNRYSYAVIDSHADVNVYEMYYIAKHKPELNRDSNTEHLLSIELPEHDFSEIFIIEKESGLGVTS